MLQLRKSGRECCHQKNSERQKVSSSVMNSECINNIFIGFYRQVMENHQKLVDAATNEESNEGHEPPVLGATPTPWKASTSVAVRLVLASLAKDQEQQEVFVIHL